MTDRMKTFVINGVPYRMRGDMPVDYVSLAETYDPFAQINFEDHPAYVQGFDDGFDEGYDKYLSERWSE